MSLSNAQSNREHAIKWKALFFAFRCSLYLKQAILAYKIKKYIISAWQLFSSCLYVCMLLLGSWWGILNVSWAGLAWGCWRTQRMYHLHLGWNECEYTVLTDWQAVGNTFEQTGFYGPLVWGARALRRQGCVWGDRAVLHCSPQSRLPLRVFFPGRFVWVPVGFGRDPS